MIRLVWVLIAALIAIFGSLFGLKRCEDGAAQQSRTSAVKALSPHS